ncbi:class I SAM-dependent methyltransferase [Terasakiella sp. SH-1]|uniref:class I SAM-dependent methyltransferase n=1 Tax=Terasakiella sp. SH-1 TaxID=2560057 RepID=UPI001073DD62|nr:class I SAM-dependent methyltransferase [Terasakiella sp. SH-1]
MKEHWEKVYCSKAENEVSWFQVEAKTSLRLVKEYRFCDQASIIDIGGGASRLVDGLVTENLKVSVLDLSAAALEKSQARLGKHSSSVHWMIGDVTTISLPKHCYDIWHDRAVFHFLTDMEKRNAYKAQLVQALKPQGRLIISTFAQDGPQKCSGLPVRRYSVDSLVQEIGNAFKLLHTEKETHLTPWAAEQKFIYCVFEKL